MPALEARPETLGLSYFQIDNKGFQGIHSTFPFSSSFPAPCPGLLGREREREAEMQMEMMEVGMGLGMGMGLELDIEIHR